MRTAARLTQKQLAEIVSVSPKTILSIEKEEYSPSLMLAYRLSLVFGMPMEELFCLKENRQTEDEKK